MGTYYVRVDGNDTTGDGSTGNPWATLGKAIATMSTAGGHTVLIGAGTYTQDGNLNKSHTALTTVKPEVDGAAVHLTNSSTNGVFALTTPCNNFRFENLIFDGSATAAQVLYPAVTGTNITNITFYRCTFNANGKTGQYCLKTYVSGTVSIAITFDTCTFSSNQTNANGFIYAQCATPASQVVTYTFTNCTASNSTSSNLTNMQGVTNTVISGGTWTSGGMAIVLGADAATGYVTAGCQVKNATITSTGSHSVLFGGGTSGCTLNDCAILAGNNGIVDKGTSNTFANNTVSPYATTAGHIVLLKGCTSSTVTGNRITVSGATYYAVSNSDGTAVTVASANIHDNIFILQSGGRGVLWVTAQDGGSNVINSNKFKSESGGNLGSILGTACATIPTLRAAWAAYGDGTNDSSSTMFSSGHEAETLLLIFGR